MCPLAFLYQKGTAHHVSKEKKKRRRKRRIVRRVTTSLFCPFRKRGSAWRAVLISASREGGEKKGGKKRKKRNRKDIAQDAPLTFFQKKSAGEDVVPS